MEFIDVFDENNNYLGYSKERKYVHDNKLWHHHASVWIMNDKGEILLQQRSFNKTKNPGKWSRTGGHVDSGETPIDAVKRETYEEIGLLIDTDNLANMEVYKSDNDIENYFTYGYIYYTDKKENEFILQKEEVNKVKYFTIEELIQLRKDNNNDYTFSRWSEEEFNKHISILKEYRDYILNNK